MSHSSLNHETLLAQKFSRQRGRRFAQTIDFVLRLIFPLEILLHGQTVFSGNDAELAQPFGIDVQTARRLMHRPRVSFLSLAAQEPIDKELSGIGMGRIFSATK